MGQNMPRGRWRLHCLYPGIARDSLESGYLYIFNTQLQCFHYSTDAFSVVCNHCIPSTSSISLHLCEPVLGALCNQPLRHRHLLQLLPGSLTGVPNTICALSTQCSGSSKHLFTSSSISGL